MVQIVIKRNIASVFCLLFSVICYSQITLSQIERADTTGQLVYMIQTIDSTGIQEYVLKSTVLSGMDNPTIDTFLIQNDTLFASLEDDGEENKFVVLSSYLPRGVTDQANGLDISLNGNNIETALDPSENSTQAPALADLVIIEDVTDGGIHSATLTQLQTLIDTDSDAQMIYYYPSSDVILITGGNTIDITEVDTKRDVTDQANGLDISLNGNNIETALDPSENSTQAPALADLVIIEDVTDGGIHSATLTQLQTLISDPQTLSYYPNTDIITISGGNTIDITEVDTDTQRGVTDQANGLDISLNGNNIETALDPSENSTQAPALADLVIIEDVTDGGIHSATLTQLKTAINTDNQTLDAFRFMNPNLRLSLSGDGEATKVLDISQINYWFRSFGYLYSGLGVRAIVGNQSVNPYAFTVSVSADEGVYVDGDSRFEDQVAIGGAPDSTYELKVYGDGQFTGDLDITGTLTKGAGSFRIDHPLDPENKYLQHSFVESPDMLNIYTGNAICGREGVSFVAMPDYFKALNRDYTYHLTPIGEFAHLKVQIEISDCLETVGAELKEYPCFIVSGGYDGLKFSWMVTGIRKDLYAEENRIQVELDKRRPGRIYHSKNK